MPLYEYRCKMCGHEFEQMMKMSESHIRPPCPNEIVPFEMNPHARSCWQNARKVLAEGGSEVLWYYSYNDDLNPIINIHEHTEGLINYRHDVQEDGSPCGVNVCMTVADWIRKETRVCGGETEKVMSRGSFHLKGSGWEADGYA